MPSPNRTASLRQLLNMLIIGMFVNMLRNGHPRSPQRRLVFALIETARHMRTYIDQMARTGGTTRAQWGLLARLRRMDGPSQNDLADGMELTPIAVGRLVDRLAEQGLIERRADPRDRRINRLFLTPAGEATIDALDPLREAVAAGALAGITRAEVEATLSVLDRIARNLRAAGKADPASHSLSSTPSAALPPPRRLSRRTERLT